MKRVIALALCLVLMLGLMPTAGAVDDGIVESTIIALGVMTGDRDGNMNLSQNVTRAEFVKMLTWASAYKDIASKSAGAQLFKDVAPSHWASGYVKTAVDAKWVVGYTDGTFRPDNTILLEEAASAILKLLGYGAADLSGAYPAAQVNKLFELGLDDGVSLKLGQPLTRYECMYIFYNLMSAATKQGSVYGKTLGYAMNADNTIDYWALVTSGLEGPFIMTGDTFSIDLTFNPAAIYRDGKAASLGDILRYDVVYYNANMRTLWVYSDKATGVYTAALPNTVAPTSVTVGSKSYTLGTHTAKTRMSSSGSFTVGDAVTLLLGMNGEVVDAVSGIGDIDYWEFITANIDGPYVNDAGLAALLPFSTDGAAVYRDNKAASADDIALYDIIYYNESAKVIWAYSEKVTGVYTAATPNAVAPVSVTVGGKSYTIGTQSAKTKLSTGFAAGDAVTLLLGMNGEVVEILSGIDDIDYWEYATASIEGPFVNYTSVQQIVPFSTGDAVVYRNNKTASAAQIERYDVLYYNASSKTIWAYSDRAIGVYTAASPGIVSPNTVTVGGISYTLGTAAAKNKLSSVGTYAIGDTVALLLGMDGTVADVVDATLVDGTYYGAVVSIEMTSDVEYMLTVACTDGTTRQCVVTSSSYTAGSAVSVSYSKGVQTVKRISSGSLSGTVSGRTLGGYTIASDAQIIDVAKSGDSKVIYASRLSGVKLESGMVTYYALNSAGEISHLILKDVTGDMYEYGIVTAVSEVMGNFEFNGTYSYVLNGRTGTVKTTTHFLGAKRGGAVFYSTGGVIDDIKNLSEVKLDDLTALSARSGNKSYALDENVQVYLKTDSTYKQINLSAVSPEEYNITGYYETTYAAGGQLRLIVAEKKLIK